MGLGELHLVNPRYFPHADADARAAGALDVLQQARVHESLAAALGGCVLSVATSSRRRELPHPMLDARAAAIELIAAASAGPVAIVFGNETSGLSNEEAGLCQIWACVPANPEYASLNLACAVQVFAYEARMACVSAEVPQAAASPPASFEQIEHLHRHFEQTLAHTGFHDPANPKKLLPRLRRMLARARLESEEVDILRGFLKAVDKMRK
jgi:tRNA/rRNA methyltransferase